MELDLRLGDSKPKPIFSFISKTHSEPPVQLELLPPTPVQRHSPPPHHLRLPWLTHYKDARVEEEESPKVGKRNRDLEKRLSIKVETDQRGGGTSARGSYEEENVSGRKKLRLSKEQSAFLEESFKEHHTLNPKQKLILAKKLSLRPRQVEVWFQNRRARTKLKQTEVDCEYLKRYCETLREENRRLKKEVQELRALNNTSSTNISNPNFHMHQLPATTLTFCPSCERVARLRNTADVRSVASLAC